MYKSKSFYLPKSKDFIHIYNKLSVWGKIILFIFLFLIVISIFRMFIKEKREGFTDTNSFVFHDNDNIYDGFYADIYDILVYSDVKDDYEVGQILNKTTPTTESIILDVGSGTGHHVALLAEKGFNVIGLDKSQEMIKKAKSNFPNLNFVNGDIMNANQFHPQSFTHVLCLYFTIYYIKNKSQFFSNCYNLLMPGGYLVVHIVDRALFDPILPSANPLLLLSPQRYAKQRITNSKITFDDFKYEANFELNESSNQANFIEKFQNKESGKVFRKNEHIFYMEQEDHIIQMAQEVGFIIQGKIDLIHSGYEYQYLYLLQKPE